METKRLRSQRLHPSVVVFCRHGDRTPGVLRAVDEPYWKELIAFPLEASGIRSQLTRKGVADLKAVAKELRSRFPLQLNNIEPTRLGLYSTDYERTFQSARTFGEEILGSNGTTSSIKITRNQKKDDPLDPWESDTQYQRLVLEYFSEHPEAQLTLENLRSVERRVLTAPILKEIFSERPFTWLEALDVIICASSNEKSPSSQELKAHADETNTATLTLFRTLYQDPTLRSLATKRILSGLCSWFTQQWCLDVIEEQPSWYKINVNDDFAFIACHDVTLIPLQAVFDWQTLETKWPPYGFYFTFSFDGINVELADSLGCNKTYRWAEFLDIVNLFDDAQQYKQVHEGCGTTAESVVNTRLNLKKGRS